MEVEGQLGNGWFRGRLGFRGGIRNVYGPELGALAQLEVTFANGHRQTVVTDDTWSAGPSAVTVNDLYDDWHGSVRLQVTRAGNIVSDQARSCTIASLGTETLTFRQRIPDSPGHYLLVAVLDSVSGKPVLSIRDIEVEAPSDE